VLRPFAPPLPLPLHARASRRGVFLPFRQRRSHTTASLTCKSGQEVFFKKCRLDAVCPPLPPSLARVGRRFFFVVSTPSATTTSLACKCGNGVAVIRCFDAVRQPPPPSLARVGRRWFVLYHLGFVRPPLPPSLSRAGRNSFLRHFDTVRHHHHLPRMQAQAWGKILTQFRHRSPTSSRACKGEQEIFFYAVSTLVAHLALTPFHFFHPPLVSIYLLVPLYLYCHS
jgi:hypothetical protein